MKNKLGIVFTKHSKQRMKERKINEKQCLKAIENHKTKIELELSIYKFIGKNGVEVVLSDHGEIKKVITVTGEGSASRKYKKTNNFKKNKKKIRRQKKRLGTTIN